MIRAIGYCRVSTKDQAEHGTSIGYQREKIRKCIDEHGWRFIDILEDNQTGTEIDVRKGMKEVISRIDEWDVLVVMKPDRLSRSFGDAENMFKHIFEPQHKNVWSVEMDINLTDNPEMRQFKSVIADMEVRNIRTRVNQGMKSASEGGYWIGKPPFGYKLEIVGKSHKDRKVLVPDEEKEEKLQNIFYGAINGASSKEIEQTVGVGRKTIEYILRNPVYYGWRKLVDKEIKRESGLIVDVIKTTRWVKHSYPLIIDSRILEKCFTMFDIGSRIKEVELHGKNHHK